jgi:hypothetical protein
MTKLIRFESEPVDPAQSYGMDYGFAPPPASGRGTLAITELMMTVVLTVGILIAATAVTYGVVRADKPPIMSASADLAKAAALAPARHTQI